MLLIKAFTDEVRFQNLEGSGKRLELVKNLSAAPMSPALSEEIFSSLATAARPAESAVPVVNPAAPRPAAPVAPAVPVSSSASEIRMMRADEGVKLARLFYKNRDYNYEDDVFFPEKIQELIEGGLQKSAVAVLPNGEFAAHLAIIKRKADSFVGETGRGAVDPAHRGDGLFEMLKRRLIEQAREDEMYGLYSESSIMDQYIQRTNMALGAKETGISLGGVLENGDTAGQASLLMYLRTGEEPNRIVYPPFHHRTMIGRIYEYGGFHRHLDNMSLSAHPPVKPGDVSRLESKMIPETGVGYITVLHYGSDLQDAVNAQLQDLMRQRINNVYLDLPLANAATPGLCGAVEVLGFFFSGIIPETSSGDVLRLQYLTRPDAGIANARPVTDFSRDLLDYVISMSPV
jgi:serine/threonine-protein kinase RsbW